MRDFNQAIRPAEANVADCRPSFTNNIHILHGEWKVTNFFIISSEWYLTMTVLNMLEHINFSIIRFQEFESATMMNISFRSYVKHIYIDAIDR